MPDLDQSSELLQLLGEPTRLRLLALLGEHELTVNELTVVTQLSQSRVSTHLGKLRDANLVRDRRQGTSSYYQLNEGAMPAGYDKLWSLVRGALDDDQLGADGARVQDVLLTRGEDAKWPDLIAGEMERHYSPGRTWEATARAFLGFADMGRVLDLGAGDGAITQLLSTRCESVLCVDISERLVRAAEARLKGLPHVRCTQGDMHAIPAEDGSFDTVLMLNLLTHSDDPPGAVREAARVLAPGGRLVVVTLDAHSHEDAAAAYGHVQYGFAPTALRAMLQDAGLHVELCEVTSRERRPPNFAIVSAFATRTSGSKPRGR